MSIEERDYGNRFVVELFAIDRLPADATPRARISWRGEPTDVAPGDHINLRVGLDFGRKLYFKKIGAVEFAATPPEILTAATPTRREKIAAQIETMRGDLFHRIIGAPPGEGG